MLYGLALVGCETRTDAENIPTNRSEKGKLAQIHEFPRVKALLASRFEDLNDLQTVVGIDYVTDEEGTDSVGYNTPAVCLNYGGNRFCVVGVLETGITQGDIIKVRDGDVWDALGLMINSPYSIANRVDLNKIYKLARRRDYYFGEGDVAFFDLAEASVNNIATIDLAYLTSRDSSEKGYVNTFNHVTAQALITTIFSRDIADFIADAHERHHMPELLTGNFTPEQLTDPDNNPIDNYVDIVNNELGQALGLFLREKYGVTNDTYWTPELLANCCNEIQKFYSWSFQMGMKPFRADDPLMIRFAGKVNQVAGGVPYNVYSN